MVYAVKFVLVIIFKLYLRFWEVINDPVITVEFYLYDILVRFYKANC